MCEKTFDKRLQELIREVANLPVDQQKKLVPFIEKTKQRHQEIKDNIDNIEDSFINLRICIKYILFDLEATRRERDYLKNMLNNQQPPDTAEGGV